MMADESHFRNKLLRKRNIMEYLKRVVKGNNIEDIYLLIYNK